MSSDVPPDEPTVSIVSGAFVPAAAERRRWARVTAVSWRLLVVRVLVSGVAVVLTVALVPGLAFTDWRGGRFLVVAVGYAVLTSVVKPALEFLALRFLVATYGFVVIVVNGFLLFLLAQLLDDYLRYDRLWQLLVGGLLVGVIGLLLETAVGASPPVLDTPRAEGVP